MMERVDIDLNKFMQKQDDIRVSFENLVDSVEDDLSALHDIIKKIYKKSESYDGYDYREDMKTILEDLL